jgi:hypothetical protein
MNRRPTTANVEPAAGTCCRSIGGSTLVRRTVAVCATNVIATFLQSSQRLFSQGSWYSRYEMGYFFGFFGGNLLVHSRDRVTHARTVSCWFRQDFGITTYSFIGLPFIGSRSDAPFFSMSSSRLSSGKRTNRSFPYSPANMFPFTKADMFPNIGRIVTRGSSGKIDLKNSLESSFGCGIFI